MGKVDRLPSTSSPCMWGVTEVRSVPQSVGRELNRRGSGVRVVESSFGGRVGVRSIDREGTRTL